MIALIAPSILRSSVLDLRHIVLSFLFVPHYHPNFPGVIWPVVIPGWSLNYELFFYALFGCALFLSASYRAGLTIILLGMFVMVGQYLSSANPVIATYTNSLLLEFILGIIVGEVFLLANPAHTGAMFVLFGFFTGLIVACGIAGVTIGRPFVYGIPSACLLSLLIWLEQWKLLFSSTILVAVGDASYSIYLTHPAVIAAIRYVGDELRLDGSHPAGGLLALVAALIVSSSLGWLIFVLFERPTTKTLNSLFGRSVPRQWAATDLPSTGSKNS
jgi:exopolysaccharide production protein ExoZ